MIVQAGYREGLNQGKERTIQQGFDAGVTVYAQYKSAYIYTLRLHNNRQWMTSSPATAGFTQGCATGYEWGLLQGATSTLKVFAGQMQGVPVQEVYAEPYADLAPSCDVCLALSCRPCALQATALADKLDLPKKHVMLSQCDALMQQDTAQGTTIALSHPHSCNMA